MKETAHHQLGRLSRVPGKNIDSAANVRGIIPFARGRGDSNLMRPGPWRAVGAVIGALLVGSCTTEIVTLGPRPGVCGDARLDPGESCDDGNRIDGDGCSADCQRDEPDLCGNGRVNLGEACDHGATGNGDDRDCRSDCIVNRCGDGHVNTAGANVEQCDAALPAAPGIDIAVPTETAACNLDCTIPVCGDSKINGHFTPVGAEGPEQCDRGSANSDNADCTAVCRVNLCGDGHVNTRGPMGLEACDDGNTLSGDGCRSDCVLE